jgi:hypothetical protein
MYGLLCCYPRKTEILNCCLTAACIKCVAPLVKRDLVIRRRITRIICWVIVHFWWWFCSAILVIGKVVLYATMQFTAEFITDKTSMGTLPDKRFYRFTLTTEPCARTCEDCRPRVHNYAVTHCDRHYPFRFETHAHRKDTKDHFLCMYRFKTPFACSSYGRIDQILPYAAFGVCGRCCYQRFGPWSCISHEFEKLLNNFLVSSNV